MKTLLKYLVCVYILNVTLYSQQSNFLPLNIGNEYQMYDGYEYQFGKIERDTVYPNGKTYFHLPSPFDFLDCRGDSVGNVLSISRPFFGGPPSPEEYMLFKADAVLDEVWPIAWDFNPVIDTGYGKCIYVDSVYLFGKTRLVKGVLIFDFSYEYYSFWLAEELGLVREHYDDGTTSWLNYAKIDGKIYGTLVPVDEDLNSLPEKFELFQNYSNPFNPITSIQYAIGSRQFVTLKVYDVLGNEIITLINEEKPVGDYEVQFDASKQASGIYFYQLRAGDYIETKKMILLK